MTSFVAITIASAFIARAGLIPPILDVTAACVDSRPVWTIENSGGQMRRPEGFKITRDRDAGIAQECNVSDPWMWCAGVKLPAGQAFTVRGVPAWTGEPFTLTMSGGAYASISCAAPPSEQ